MVGYITGVKQTNQAPEPTMKKTLNILAKTFSLLNLIVAVCTGKEVAAAQVTFNNCWFN